MNIKNDHIETMEELVYSKPRVTYLSTQKRFEEINLSMKGQAYISHRFRDFHAFSCAKTIAFNRKEDFAENMYGLGKSTSRITFISAAQYSKYCLEDDMYNNHQLFFHRYSGYKSTTKKKKNKLFWKGVSGSTKTICILFRQGRYKKGYIYTVFYV